MKKIMSIILSAALLLALAAPAAAAQAPEPAPEEAEKPDTSQRLAQVTAKVKSTLGIDKEYEEFYGELSENELSPVWNLTWSGEGEELMVEATESGKIISYYTSSEADYNTPSSAGGNYLPAFPAVSREQAQTSAEAFLKKVLDASLETARFLDRSMGRLSTSSHYFNGGILLNGLPSPLTFSITVRASDGKVIRFYREDLEQDTIGGVPSARPGSSQEAAGTQLKQTLDLRLEYVLSPGSKEAVLQYLPEPSDDYYVDAQTGKLVNLTELYNDIRNQGFFNGMSSGDAGAAPEAAADMAAGSLSQAELSGISKLEGVLDKEALDKGLQKLTALGLDKYTFGSANYSLDRETNDVTARLTYSRKEGDLFWRRTVICDGKTGALLSVYSSSPYEEERKASVNEDAARRTAEAFLEELWGEDFEKTALYDSDAWNGERWSSAHSFQFAQQENGYFFPENSLHIAVDVTDGTISRLDRTWTEDVAFGSTEGIADKSAALDAWFSHYDVKLAYRYIPVKLDPGMDGMEPLLEKGYSYFNHLKLSYAIEEERYASGVDAASGKVVYQDTASSDGALSYSDVSDHWAREQIETLARYGIGWGGGVCQPRKELTQLDLVALLSSAAGYRYDPDSDGADSLYSYAYSTGILARTERQDSKPMTRGETVQMLLNGAGFGRVAKLPGIFTCSYADKDTIPAGMLGFAALAQGLGMVSASGDFAAGRTATRAEAAVMLYNLMNAG